MHAFPQSSPGGTKQKFPEQPRRGLSFPCLSLSLKARLGSPQLLYPQPTHPTHTLQVFSGKDCGDCVEGVRAGACGGGVGRGRGWGTTPWLFPVKGGPGDNLILGCGFFWCIEVDQGSVLFIQRNYNQPRELAGGGSWGWWGRGGGFMCI